MRNGVNSATNNYQNAKKNENEQSANNRKNNIDRDRGLQEPWEWYDKCFVRERNKGELVIPSCLDTIRHKQVLHTER